MKISKNSSLYKLLRLGWMSEGQTENTNLCAVFWTALWGLCISCALVVAGAGIGFALLVAPIIVLLVWAQTGIFHAADPFWAVGFVVWGLIAIMLLLFGIAEYRLHLRDKNYDAYLEKQRRREENPGLLRTAYRSWKEKTCVLIQFEDDVK